MSSIQMIPQYDTKLFTEIWESAADFKTEFLASPFASSISSTSPDNVTTLYYLLYARYGNSPICNMDENQFKYKIYSTIFQYGPTWEKRLDIQAKLRALTEADLMTGAKAIYNSAYNPSTAPTTGSLEELEYINGQNTTNYKKSKMEAYSILWELLKTDVTSAFLGKFRTCFKQFVKPEFTRIYVSEEDEGED